VSDWSPIPLSVQSYRAESLPASAQRLVNLYAEAMPEGSKGPVLLLPVPGLLSFAEVGDGPIRGLHALRPYLFAVSGNELYRIDEGGNATLIQGTVRGNANVRMANNGSHIAIITEHEAYAYDGSGLLELNEHGFNGVAYQDGYGIFTKKASELFYLSPVDSLTTVSSGDFSSADAFADYLMGCISDHRELWLMGEETSEVWYNAGAAAFPFQRVPGGFVEKGCAAPQSLAKTEHSVVWLGDDLEVHRSVGYQPQKISTPALHKRIVEEASDPSCAVGFTYSQGGHTFYVLSFPEFTVCYDFTTGKWHDRQTHGKDRWQAQHYARAWRKHLVGDFETGKIYELDPQRYQDGTVPSQRTVTTAVLHHGGRRAIMDELKVEIEAGVGAVSGDHMDPSLFVRWSDDGGRTWSNQREAKIGKLGAYKQEVTFTRLGAYRQRVLELRLRSNVKAAICGVHGRVEVLPQ
jgi:hypothetical protein